MTDMRKALFGLTFAWMALAATMPAAHAECLEYKYDALGNRACAQDDLVNRSPYVYSAPPGIRLNAFVPTSISIACGNGGSILISLQTGTITQNNCPLDEGARAFWKAVQREAPVCR